MSHEHERSLSVGRQVWHGLATVLDTPPTTGREILVASGLDWDVLERPLFCEFTPEQLGHVVNPSEHEKLVVPSHKALVRSTDLSLLGVVGAQYTPFQNRHAVEWFEPLMADGTVKVETAGSLQGGRKVWVQGRYAEPEEIGDGDAVIPYLLLATGHDGTLSLFISNTPVRVVCWNTLQAAGAMEDAVAGDFKRASVAGVHRIQHVGDVRRKAEEAREIIVKLNREWGVTVEQYRKMRRVGFTEAQVADLAREVFDGEHAAAREALKRARNEQARRSEFEVGEQKGKLAATIDAFEKLLAEWKPGKAERVVVDAFREAPGADLAGETAWGAMNAITHYIDHGRQGDRSSRMVSSFFGDGSRQRARAFELLSEVAR